MAEVTLGAVVEWAKDVRTVMMVVGVVAATTLDVGDRLVDAYLAPERARAALEGYEELRSFATKLLVDVNLRACQAEGTPLQECNLYEIAHTGERVEPIPLGLPEHEEGE